jgi:hypothetical protein
VATRFFHCHLDRSFKAEVRLLDDVIARQVQEHAPLSFYCCNSGKTEKKEKNVLSSLRFLSKVNPSLASHIRGSLA